MSSFMLVVMAGINMALACGKSSYSSFDLDEDFSF